jgi:cytochrome d ubiquinol oxidase subunit II
MILGGVLFFLLASLTLYALLGGADFGGGVLELFLGRKAPLEQRKLISHAMAPVWEANHVWLILAVVILFVAFPRAYVLITVYLHIPVMAVLMGIVARGCAFTFRHYDSLDECYYLLYSRVFSISSLWTAFFLGVTAGALMLGRINPAATDFYGAYVSPWANGFCFATGAFTAALFALLAAAYLIGESEETTLRPVFRRKARIALVVSVIAGGLAMLTGELQGFSLARALLGSNGSVACFCAATLLLAPFWWSFSREHGAFFTRIFGAGLLALVLGGWFAAQFPYLVRAANDAGVSVSDSAPAATLRAMLFALLFGSVLIFPAFLYLLRVFKAKR